MDNTNIKIIKLNRADFPNGKTVVPGYSSDKYYDLVMSEGSNGWEIKFDLKYFNKIFTKSMPVEIFEDYKLEQECYIAEVNGTESGIISFSHQDWNNTLRIWDMYIYNEDMKRKGIGTILMNIAKKRAREINARAIVLETQTSNYTAIEFYKKNGFELTGFDKLAYTNKDVERGEVRIEMGFVVN